MSTAITCIRVYTKRLPRTYCRLHKPVQCRAYTHTHDAALVDDLLYDLAVLADDLADEGARHLDGLLGVLQQRARRLHRVRRLRDMTVHYSYSILYSINNTLKSTTALLLFTTKFMFLKIFVAFM